MRSGSSRGKKKEAQAKKPTPSKSKPAKMVFDSDGDVVTDDAEDFTQADIEKMNQVKHLAAVKKRREEEKDAVSTTSSDYDSTPDEGASNASESDAEDSDVDEEEEEEDEGEDSKKRKRKAASGNGNKRPKYDHTASGMVHVGKPVTKWNLDKTFDPLPLGNSVNVSEGAMLISVEDIMLKSAEDPDTRSVVRKCVLRKPYVSKKTGAKEYFNIDIPARDLDALAEAIAGMAYMVNNAPKPTEEAFMKRLRKLKAKQEVAMKEKKKRACLGKLV